MARFFSKIEYMFMSSKRKLKSFDGIDWLILVFIVVALICRLYILYFPFRFYSYLVLPGNDAVSHLAMVKQVLAGSWNSSYPLFFHAVIAFLSKTFSKSPLDTMLAVTPALVVFPSIAIYYFAEKNFGRITGLIAFVLGLWANNYIMVSFGDGNYPNLLAAGFFMPIALAFLISTIKKPKWTNYLGFTVFTALLALTHHLTALLFAIILAIYFVTIAVWNRKEKITPGLKKIILFIAVALGAAAVILFLTPLREIFLTYFKLLLAQPERLGDASFTKLIDYSEYPAMVGNLVWFGGLISVIYLIYLLGKKKGEVNKPAILMILVWFVVAYVLSRLPQSGLPGRFARETAWPLLLAFSVSLTYIFRSLKYNSQKIAAFGLIGFVIFLNMSQINAGSYRTPEFFNSMIWFTAKDKEKTDFIKSATQGGDKIVTNPTTPYFDMFVERKVYLPAPNLVSTPALFESYVQANKVRYVFIGNETEANPDSSVYPFFADFEKITEFLQTGIVQELKTKHAIIVQQFSDGSVLYKIDLVNKLK
ncbi:MAG: hypothetical protein NTZ65_02960 [Candidatus Berkelbacteria bacterium]|nr:hypothetical protein [Candidatus Berkelbacteria bacterium]